MRALMLPLYAVVLGAIGCDSDCDNPSRIDGDYAVWSAVTSDAYTVTGYESDPGSQQKLLYGAFPNGWSEWDMKYVPSGEKFDLTVDGEQSFKAAYSQADDNCNVFTMGFSGIFVSDASEDGAFEGATHSFTWTGDMSYQGSHMTGTYTYSDTWTALDNGASGTIDIPMGEVRATLRGSVGDTGF